MIVFQLVHEFVDVMNTVHCLVEYWLSTMHGMNNVNRTKAFSLTGCDVIV
jgi:hypothetical protein